MDTLHYFGFNHLIQNYIDTHQLSDFIPGRVISQHKGRYTVQTDHALVEAEITGNLRFSAEDHTGFPTVGDWVLMLAFDDLYLIHHLIPRQSVLERKSVASSSEKQLIAANVDVAFVVQGLDHNFNLNRLERYLAVVYSGQIRPVILLNKADLKSAGERKNIQEQVGARVGEKVKILMLSVTTGEGFSELHDLLEQGKTYCLIGSSGVGKSSIINQLLQKNQQLTAAISETTQKGKHTTTRRELMLMPNGGVLIDTPGMRELGVVADRGGLDQAFEQIAALAQSCKFKNCSHEVEPGCAVREAVENGSLDKAIWYNYQKLKKESQRFQQSVVEKRKNDRAFGKVYKEVIQFKKKNKY